MTKEKKTIWEELKVGFNRVTLSFGDDGAGMAPQEQAQVLHNIMEQIAPILQKSYGVIPVRGQMRLDPGSAAVRFDVDMLKAPPSAPAAPTPG